nr:reverse transcriptase domain-containing protein [Tanacetum cinerariifolium]
MLNQLTNLIDLMTKFVNANTASTSNPSTLPSNTIANPRSDLKAITTRSGVAYEGTSIPTPKNVVEQKTEETTDKEQTNFQGRSTAQDQPPVVPISIPKPDVPRTQPKPTIPYPNAGYEGQRSGPVDGARDTVGSSMVQKSGIQCYNCKEYGHVARECQKPKRAKDAAYHWEKMLLCKQEEAGIQLNAEQAYWRDESDDQELEAHYMYMAKLQQVSPDDVDFGP